MAAIGAIKNNDELLKKLLEKREIGMPETQVNPYQNQTGANNVGSADAFNQKYNVQSLFQVDPNANTGGATQRFNNMQSFAGTSGGSQITNDNNITNNPLSMAGSIWVSGTEAPPANIVSGPSNVQGTGPDTNVGVYQPSQNENTKGEGALGEGENKSDNGPKFGAGDIFALTGGLTLSPTFNPVTGGTETVSNTTGDATLSLNANNQQGAENPEGVPNGELGNVNGNNNNVNNNPADNKDDPNKNGDNGAGNSEKEINKQEQRKLEQEQQEIKLRKQEEDEAA